VLLALGLAPLPAVAQGTRTEYLRRFDHNRDGRVSETEYVAYMSRGFRRLDLDRDGVLEARELPGGHGVPITLKAFQGNLRRQFHKLDAGHHGYLNAEELTAPPR
jgi:Ca2+-binding EF-hand superfamily protein